MAPADLRRLLRAPAPALPRALDVVAEAWAGLVPRARIAVGVLAVLLVGLVTSAATRAPWGPARTVVVVTGQLPAGHRLTAADLRLATVPAGALPHGAIVQPAAAQGRRLAGPVASGQILATTSLVDGDITAQLQPGRVAVAVPHEAMPQLTVGAIVDVAAAAGAADGAPRAVARDARVLGRDEGHVWLEVDRDHAPAVAAALAWGQLTVAIVSAPTGW